MKFAVVIPTYERPDGKTNELLIRALNSVRSQTFPYYEIFLIGDQWGKIKELKKISDHFACNLINLSKAKERHKYEFGDYRLFCAGGVNATNKGIEEALTKGYNHICHLDHDDYWREDHLEIISSKAERYFMVVTKSTYMDGTLPKFDSSREFFPVPCGMIHSATCINFRKTELRFRDCYEETGTAWPADADLWNRLNDKVAYFINEITCFHDNEGYSLK